MRCARLERCASRFSGKLEAQLEIRRSERVPGTLRPFDDAGSVLPEVLPEA